MCVQRPDLGNYVVSNNLINHRWLRYINFERITQVNLTLEQIIW